MPTIKKYESYEQFNNHFLKPPVESYEYEPH